MNWYMCQCCIIICYFFSSTKHDNTLFLSDYRIWKIFSLNYALPMLIVFFSQIWGVRIPLRYHDDSDSVSGLVSIYRDSQSDQKHSTQINELLNFFLTKYGEKPCHRAQTQIRPNHMSFKRARRAESNDTKIFLSLQLWAEIQVLEYTKNQKNYLP